MNYKIRIFGLEDVDKSKFTNQQITTNHGLIKFKVN